MFAHCLIYRESCVNGNEKSMTSGQVEEIQLFHRFHLTGEIPENTDDPKAIISCHVLLSRKLKKIGNFVKLMQLFPPKYRGGITAPINRWSVSVVHSL